MGIGAGDTVAVMAPNVPAMLEAHYGVPMAGGVINALNYRLDPPAIAFILAHGEAKVLITDREFSPTFARAELCQVGPLVIDIDAAVRRAGERLGKPSTRSFSPTAIRFPPHASGRRMAGHRLNYTSGTTGNPKGVVYPSSRRLPDALGNVAGLEHAPHARYLWTLPMFHCNGWCFTWALSGVAGTHVCLREWTAERTMRRSRAHGVTHLCGAPIVLNMLANAPDQAPQVSTTRSKS